VWQYLDKEKQKGQAAAGGGGGGGRGKGGKGKEGRGQWSQAEKSWRRSLAGQASMMCCLQKRWGNTLLGVALGSKLLEVPGEGMLSREQLGWEVGVACTALYP